MTKQPTNNLEYSHPFLRATAEEFGYYKSFAERAIAQISDEQLHVPLDGNTNSVMVIMKHMAGNMMSRWTDFLTTDGEKPDRDRDGEFVDDIASRAEILRRWEAAWGLVFATLSSLKTEDLDKTVYVRSEPHTIYRAIQRQLAHAANHVGQIVMICRYLAKDEWEVLTIARGGSKEFLAKMREKFKANG